MTTISSTAARAAALLALVAVATTGAVARAAGSGAAAPAARLVGTPVLIAITGHVDSDRPTAYVFFRLSKHLHEPRLVVAQVKGASGRTYAVRGTRVRNCYKSALLLQGTPHKRLRAGVPYHVSFVSRRTPHQRTSGIEPFVTTYVTARARSSARFVPRAACGG
jgi:hypothetical protein